MTQTEELQPILEVSAATQTKPTTNVLDKAILDAIDYAFQMLGNAGSEAIYRCIRETYGLSKSDIPRRFDQFVEAVEAIFGKASCLLEIEILEALHKQLPEFKFAPEPGAFSLVSYVEAMRHNL